MTARTAPSAPSATTGAPRVVANLYFIKHANGLFWYAVDYLRALEGVETVLVRTGMGEVARAALPGMRVVEAGGREAMAELSRAVRAGAFLYCPTSHPLPFVSRQIVVLHDLFPFKEGGKGRVKEALFLGSLRTSRCTVGFINRSVSGRFLSQRGIPESQTLYAPNAISAPEGAPTVPAPGGGGRTRVGLMGTDGHKKGYGPLFASASALGLASRLEFVLFGGETPYTAELRRAHPDVPFRLVDPRRSSLEAFLAGTDVLLSLSEDEGFGRPLAAGVMRGIPAFVRHGPIAEEFFAGLVETFDDPRPVLERLGTGHIPAAPPEEARRRLADRLRRDMGAAVEALGRLSTPVV
jgi:hypothetical protein